MENQRVGREGEQAVAAALARRGFAVMARNLRFRGAEVDLLARRDDTLLLVEVKARSSARGPPPEASVGPRKIAKLELAARHLALRHPGARIRIAVAAVCLAPSGPPSIHWFLDPFSAS